MKSSDGGVAAAFDGIAIEGEQGHGLILDTADVGAGDDEISVRVLSESSDEREVWSDGPKSAGGCDAP